LIKTNTRHTFRVGRAPKRKLSGNDRLIAPAKQYQDLYGHSPASLAKAIAAALTYDVKEDEEAVAIQQLIKQKGLDQAIEEITGLNRNSELVKLIVEEIKK
jgi:mannitol-1-phosphate 5-dehydrogenase